MGQQAQFFPEKTLDAAAWLEAALERHWGRSKAANYAAAVVPQGFSAYARIFHPAYRAGGREEITWAEVAGQYGHEVHAQAQWAAIATQGEDAGHATALGEPATGSLPERQVRALADLLRRYTTTPEECFFAVWEGWGAFKPEVPWNEAARLHLPDRSYYLLRGTIEAAAKSISPSFWQSPSLWWPKDRAWCVATEVDLMSTYMGSTAACIQVILSDPRLEAWPVTRADRVDAGSDRVNG